MHGDGPMKQTLRSEIKPSNDKFFATGAASLRSDTPQIVSLIPDFLRQQAEQMIDGGGVR